MPLGEWTRRLGALPQKRMTASWSGSKRIQPNTSSARALAVRPGGLPSDGRKHRFGPIACRMPPCSPPSRCGLARMERGVRSAQRPTLTASARDGRMHSRSGRKNARGAGQTKECTKKDLHNELRALDKESYAGKPHVRVWAGGARQLASLPLQRREFIALVGGTASWPLIARAQPSGRKDPPAVGFLPNGKSSRAANKSSTCTGLRSMNARPVSTPDRSAPSE